MNNLNQVILEGNVVRKPEVNNLPSGTHASMIPIAVNRFYKKNDGTSAEEVSFFDVETYGSMADYTSEKCTKGRFIRVVGRLKQLRWKNSEEKSQSKVTIIAEHVELKPVSSSAASNSKKNATADSGNDSASSILEAQSQTLSEQDLPDETVF